MSGITRYGAYLPLWRLKRDAVAKGLPGEKSVANFDEDSITMAVAGGVDCLGKTPRESVDGLFFASTTSPYREKLSATTVATALDLRRDVLTADFANSIRCGTIALKAALDTVAAGSAKQVLVVSSEMRVGIPGSDNEQNFGDASAAFLISKDASVSVEAYHSINDEILDSWRLDSEQFNRSWESRFVAVQGYGKVVPEAVTGMLKKAKLTPKDFAKAIFALPDVRRQRELAQHLGFDPKTQLQDSLFAGIGDSGAAYPLMLLSAALETAKVGDRLLLVAYGNGCDVFIFKVDKAIEAPARGLAKHLAAKRVTDDYIGYLKWRNILPKNAPLWPQAVPPVSYLSVPAIYRERDQNIRLQGVKCKNCGTVQYPVQRVCTKCHAKDNFEPARLSDKKATVFSFSADYINSPIDSPIGITLVDFEGGGRAQFYLTDRDIKQVRIGMPVEMSFRLLESRDGIHNYFWKTVPIRA